MKNQSSKYDHSFVENSILFAKDWFSFSDNSFSFCEHWTSYIEKITWNGTEVEQKLVQKNNMKSLTWGWKRIHRSHFTLTYQSRKISSNSNFGMRLAAFYSVGRHHSESKQHKHGKMAKIEVGGSVIVFVLEGRSSRPTPPRSLDSFISQCVES